MRNQLVCFSRKAAKVTNRIAYRAAIALFCLAAVLLAGCASTKPKTEAEKVHQRGWIGGEFKLARKISAWTVIFGSREEFIATFPHGLESSNRAGILITAASSNAPVRQAGLRKGDLILALNRQPMTTLKAFRRMVDRSEPGTSLPINAWRDGKTFECNVTVGRETFKNWGTIALGFGFPNLSNLGPLDLLPDPE
ncbi:MAG TPA: PDZ domain-containing protein, partial [Verrucomicrobiae bacterium]|nr:PDZ domain-containing protein [Verrucomicrobiae bacterium]